MVETRHKYLEPQVLIADWRELAARHSGAEAERLNRLADQLTQSAWARDWVSPTEYRNRRKTIKLEWSPPCSYYDSKTS